MFKKKIYFFILFFGSMLSCLAQESDATKELPKSSNVLFLEMGGSGFLYSVNYERIKHLNEGIKISGRFGFSYFKREGLVFGAIPVTASVIFKDKKDKLNLNIGAGLYCSTYPYYYYFTPTGLVAFRFNFINGENKNYIQVSYTPFLSKISYFENSNDVIKWGVYQWFGLSIAQEF